MEDLLVTSEDCTLYKRPLTYGMLARYDQLGGTLIIEGTFLTSKNMVW